MKAIQSIVYVLTGVNIFAKANSKAFASMAGNAKKAKNETKQLAGIHSEINNISDNNNDSHSDSDGQILPSFDLTNIDTQMTNFIEKVKTKIVELSIIFKEGFSISFGNTNFDEINIHLNNIKENITKIWNDPEVLNSAQNWGQTLLISLGEITGGISKMGVNLAEGFVGSIEKYLLDNTERIKSFISNMFNISSENLNLTGNFSKALGEISDVFGSDIAKQIGSNIIAIFVNPLMSVIELLSKFVTDVLAIFFQPIIDNVDLLKLAIQNTLEPIQTITNTISEMLTFIGDKLNELYDEKIGPLMDSLKIGISDTFGKFLEVWNTYFVPFLENFSNGIKQLWENHLKPFVDNVMGLIGSLIDVIKLLWENVIKKFIDWIIQNIIPNIVPVLETIWGFIQNIFSGISDVIGGIIRILKGLIDFFIGVFTGNWNKACEGIKTVFSGIGNCIKGVINFVLGGMENFVNGIIRGVNIVLSIVNKVANAVGSLFGLKPINLQISTISLPRLAKGGVLTKATAIIAGEYSGASSNPEIVTPQNIMEETFGRVMSKYNNNNNQQHLSIHYMGKEIFNDTIDYINEKTRRTGKCVIKVGG